MRHSHRGEIILHPCRPSIYNLLAKVLRATNCQEVNLSAWRAGVAQARSQGVQNRDFCGLGVREGSAAATKSCWAVQCSETSVMLAQEHFAGAQPVGEVGRGMEQLEVLVGLSKWLLEVGIS